jgi:tripartite-type tricarboxylate transporter receptor subunit TctC
MHEHSYRIANTLFAAACAAATPAFAAAAPLPPENVRGAIAWRSGGIGMDEAQAMQHAANRYPLEVMFLEHDRNGAAGYLAGERVVIRDHDGRPVLNTVSAGPYLLARLPQGQYTITAWRRRKAEERSVTIAPLHHERVAFEW